MIEEKIQLRLCGHAKRMIDYRWLKKILGSIPPARRKRKVSRRLWKDDVNEPMEI